MKVFAQFSEFNEKLLLNLNYGKVKVGEISKQYEYVDAALQGNSVLKGEKQELLKGYIENIGSTDAQSQLNYLTEFNELLKKYKTESEEDYKKYGSLYFKISLMVGILIAVLLI